MSSTTKKTPINKESKEFIDSLQTTDQLYRSLSDYERMIKNESDIKKNKMAKEISLMGEQYIQEIDDKHELIENERLDMVDFIIKTTKQNLVNTKVLHNMSYEEVKTIYVKAQDANKPWYRLLIEFIMGW